MRAFSNCVCARNLASAERTRTKENFGFFACVFLGFLALVSTAESTAVEGPVQERNQWRHEVQAYGKKHCLLAHDMGVLLGHWSPRRSLQQSRVLSRSVTSAKCELIAKKQCLLAHDMGVLGLWSPQRCLEQSRVLSRSVASAKCKLIAKSNAFWHVTWVFFLRCQCAL